MLLFLFITTGYGQAMPWPLKGRIDLSSGFGDFRLSRFHAGVDLRTGGESGKPLFSPVDGYVWRVKMSYNGYGKGLYLKGEDGHIYVFGHLSALGEKIDRVVTKAQNEAGRYYVDLHFPPDSIPIASGEQLGLTGQTGAGAPHLHFERRNPDNLPLNPLTHGFSVDDRTRPRFERIGIQLRDDRSLLSDGSRKIFLDVTAGKQPGEYRLDTVLHLDSPFGILAHCYDQGRPGGMRQSVYSLTLTIDGREYYKSLLDTLAFEIGATVGLTFDPTQAANGEKRVRRLFTSPGASKRTGRGLNDHDGVFGYGSTDTAGYHRGVIVAVDPSGNRSELSFDFIWESPAVAVGGASGLPEVDSSGSKTLEVDYEVVEDGLIVTATAVPGIDGMAEIALYRGSLLVGREVRVPVVQSGRYHFFVPPRPEYRRVGRISVTMSRSLRDKIWGQTGVNLALLGLRDNETMVVDGRFFINCGRRNFFEPRFIAVKRVESPEGSYRPDASPVYQIMPEAFATRSKFDIDLKVNRGIKDDGKNGLCWWDEKEKQWYWLSDPADTSVARLVGEVAGTSVGGGLFAAISDYDPPMISSLNIRPGMKVTNLRPTIRFQISDTLSGIEDDRSIAIYLNDQLLIPEYDPETEICKARPYRPLAPGDCHLEIMVTDRAGNRAEQRRDFHVSEGSGSKDHK